MPPPHSSRTLPNAKLCSVEATTGCTRIDQERSTETTICFHHAIPIFRIFSSEKAKEFYVDFLGFRVHWEHRFHETAPLYVQISRGDLVIHVSEHQGDSCPGSNAIVNVTGLDQFHREISSKNYPYMRPDIETAPWNASVMEVIDPFGNHIRFNEPLK